MHLNCRAILSECAGLGIILTSKKLGILVELPPAFARFHRVRDNKTARELLVEQLQTLNDEFAQILADIHSEQIEKLEAHGKFLNQRFNRASSVFETM